MARGVIAKLDAQMDDVTMVPGEDVTVTGIARVQAGDIQLVNTTKMYFLRHYKRDYLQEELLDKTFLHHLNDTCYWENWNTFPP